MTNIFTLEKEINACKTAKQVKDLLSKHDIQIAKDNTVDIYQGPNVAKTKSLSVWLDDTTRIYYRSGLREYVLQKWSKEKRKIIGSKPYTTCEGLQQTMYDFEVTEIPDYSIHQPLVIAGRR